MGTRALTLWVGIAVVGLVLAAIALLQINSVGATSHSAERAFSAASVPAGGELVVTIEVSGLGSAGQVVETLPEGFNYLSSSLGDQASC